MRDVVIVGGGLCGLALAHSLHARGVDWQLLEARPRLGGRVLTVAEAGGPPLDLGPTWYWPATQPAMARLVDDLGLAWLDQPDDGRVLLHDDPNRAPRPHTLDAASGRLAADAATPAQPGAVHGGARRLADGMAALVDALAARLPAARLACGQVLQALQDRGDHVLLQLQPAPAAGAADAAPHAAPGALQAVGTGGPATLAARRVVLALPPRLAAAALRFQPALPPDLAEAMAATPTWMASAAKAALAVDRPAWRDAGLAGSAWVTHPQAALAEVFDAGPADPAQGAALAGFVALDAAQRPAFRRGLPLLVESQLVTLFGALQARGEPWLQDWADEPHTCTDADRADDARPGGHPAYGDARLQAPLWDGRLWLGGSETARLGGGYLEGALSAAARLRQQLAPRPG